MKILIACWLAITSTLACACKPDLPAAPGAKNETVESAKYAITYRTQPEKIAVGQHFALEFALCANDGAVAPESVRVNAVMPEHRHGMNYKTTVKNTGAGRYRAEGLMLHMPGRWEYIFEVRAAGTVERLTRSVVLQ